MKYLLVISLLLTGTLYADMSPKNTLTRSCLKDYQNQYAQFKNHKAFVYAREKETGKDRWNWSYGYDTAQKAIDSAMKGCQSYALNAECKLVDTDGVFKVKDGEFSALVAIDDRPLKKEEIKVFMQEAKPLILGNCLPFFEKYLNAKEHKSFGYSVDDNGNYACGYSFKNQTEKISKSRAINSCNTNKNKRGAKTPKSPCKVYATNKKVLLKASDFGIKLTANKERYLSTKEYKTLLEQAKEIIDDGACLIQFKYYLRSKEHQAFYFSKSKDGKQACGRKDDTFSMDVAKEKAKESCEVMAKKKGIKGSCKPFAQNFDIVAKANDFGLKEGIEDFKLAIHKSNLVKVKKYITKGFDANTQTDKDGVTAIFLAAIKGDEDFFFELIKKGAKIKHKGKDSSTLLLAAAGGKSPKILRYLLEKGLDVNAKGAHDMTPLQVALSQLDTYGAAILLRAGANASIPNEEGKTAYDMAKVWKIDLDAMKKPQLNKMNSDGFYPLFDAVKYGDSYMIQKLVKDGADVNKIEKYGTSPISMAKNENIIKLLIKLGVSINAQDDDGVTALMDAVTFGFNEDEKLQRINLLFSLGADKSIKNKKGQTAYEIAKSDQFVSDTIAEIVKP